MALQEVHIKKLTKEEIELDDNFYSKESSCSCDIDQIKGFIFGIVFFANKYVSRLNEQYHETIIFF